MLLFKSDHDLGIFILTLKGNLYEKKDVVNSFLDTNYNRIESFISSDKILKRKTQVIRRLSQFGISFFLILSFILSLILSLTSQFGLFLSFFFPLSFFSFCFAYLLGIPFIDGDYNGALFIDLTEAINTENNKSIIEKERIILQELSNINNNTFHTGSQVI